MAKGKPKTPRRHEPSIHKSSDSSADSSADGWADDSAARDLLVHETLAEIRARLLARARRVAALDDTKSSRRDACRRDVLLDTWGGPKRRWHDC